jgi:hypothetical protein
VEGGIERARGGGMLSLEGSSQGRVYVLILEGGRWYVGWSRDSVGKRLKNHLRGGGTRWTRIYPPRGVVAIYPGDKGFEKWMTVKLMRLFSWNNVRGATWSQVNISR